MMINKIFWRQIKGVFIFNLHQKQQNILLENLKIHQACCNTKFNDIHFAFLLTMSISIFAFA